jgi:hypothetical protein
MSIRVVYMAFGRATEDHRTSLQAGRSEDCDLRTVSIDLPIQAIKRQTLMIFPSIPVSSLNYVHNIVCGTAPGDTLCNECEMGFFDK